MKTNELMIGDWVFNAYHGENIQITPYDFFTHGHFEDGKYIPTGVTPSNGWDLEPIPITPEILEKNGFVQNPRSKSRRPHQICTDSVYISWWSGRLNILFKPFIGHSTNHVNVDGKYVHELQHALRICGIEKEIEL